ncbi:MAG: DUF1428 domain-containing protein [Devosia sp.]
MAYIDAFCCSVPREKLEAYKALVHKMAPLWKELGASGYMEAVGDDVPMGELTSFPRAVQAGEDDIVMISFLTYPDKAARDKVGEAMMSDARLQAMFEEMGQLTDMKLMIYGGFQPIVMG